MGYYAAERLGRRGLGVNAVSVSASMRALYSCVCVNAPVSRVDVFLQVRAWR